MSAHRAAVRPWAWLVCYLRDHDWLHDGPGTWAATCTRCRAHARVPGWRW